MVLVRIASIGLAVTASGREVCPDGSLSGGEPTMHADWESLIQASLSVSAPSNMLAGGAYVQSLRNFQDIQYDGEVRIGVQTLRMIMDTGSFDVLGFRKDDCSGCGNAAVLVCEEPKCTEARRTSQSGSCLEFGSGKACANQATADVSIGPLTSSGQSFLLGFNADMPILYESDFQGIVGIGPPKHSGDLLSNLGVRYFSACLPSGSSGKLVWNDNAPGSSFMSSPVAGQVFWGLQKVDVHFDGPSGKASVACASGCGAVIDTGTSLIAAPASAIEAAKRALESMDGSCSDLSTLPHLKFKLGGHDITLPPEAYVGQYVKKQIPWLPDWFPQPAYATCELLLIDIGDMPNTQKGPMWILGMPFFRYYYTTFDLGSSGGTDIGSMKVHMAPTDGSCCRGCRRAAGERKLMQVDPTKLIMPKWLDSVKAAGRRGHVTPF